MRLQAGAATLLCIALTAAAGCGGDDSSDFRKDYNSVVKQFRTLPNDVNTSVSTASGKPARTLATRFADLADRTDQEVTKLRKLDPPNDAKDEYDAFVDSLDTIAGDLRGISNAAGARDPSRARAETRSLLRDAQKTSKSETALRKAVD
jgi:hypothetical protein